MKKISKIVALALSLVLTGSLLAGCGKTSPTESKKGSETKQEEKSSGTEVAVILKTLSNPFWVSMKEGIEREAKAKNIKVDVFAAASEDDVQGQLKLLENLLNKNYKAIGVAPLSPVNLIPAIAQANKKGIYVVNIDEKVDMKELKNAGGSIVSFVNTDNVKVGEKGAKFITDKLGANGGEVAIIEGKAGNASGEARKVGAKKGFEAAKGIKLVASQPADWDRSKALDVATNMLQRYPNIKAFYCANDTMALGVVQAVENAGKKDKIVVVGTDGAPEAIQSVNDGKLGATVAQDSAQIGVASLNELLKALKDKPEISADKEPAVISVDSKLIVK
ncbi:D-allose transport system substrate-binding protein [Clostridium tetanomorphum]|uniref:D-allose transporter substrate-binding protein n=1 Tax=Clostridium tetanomorphum TaxID=1553 RepID=A0A923J242_CLOTT|nr:D-allose transporter substrate-binding protein [Clostridium tetanomorphum]KAJ50533.1 periplasmic binding protein/LacI transcriptional regulator [Clostridium tetanomorphum DSM 665]MBC2399867.1 D-allose transporter substrate-binding protein [Clostridium tetanomorphum]MBP1866340.1 D-allose transport system substrate-binding protein [Clostridium tetanomorphum]NRS83234.1 D-allose transport system substrate-binding protein [Clostridium tetanomorphum]NRZ98666.1 D-allose transport system substrate-